MTIAPHADPLQSEQPHQKADARDHAHKVAVVVELAETGLREAESERVTRDRIQDGLVVLRTLLTMPWSERTLEVDRVLHTEKGDLDEDRIVEYLDLLLHKKYPQTSLEARHTMVRGRAQTAFGDAWQVAQHLHAVADGLMAQEPQHAPQAPSPVRRGELPASVPVESAPEPATLPKRVPGAAGPQPSQPPMYPPAPPEAPSQQTGALVALVQDASSTGQLSRRSVQAMRDAGFGKQGPDMGRAPDPSFAAASVPQQRRVTISDTVTMRADEVLAELDAPAEVAPRGKGLAPGGVRTGASPAGASDRQFLELPDTTE